MENIGIALANVVFGTTLLVLGCIFLYFATYLTIYLMQNIWRDLKENSQNRKIE